MIANDMARFRTGTGIDPTLSMVPMGALMKWLLADGSRPEEAERQAVPDALQIRPVPPEKSLKNPPLAESPVILERIADVVVIQDAPEIPVVTVLQGFPSETHQVNVLQPAVASASVLQPISSYQPMPMLPPALVMPPLQTGERWEPRAEEREISEDAEPRVSFFANLPSVFDNLLSPQAPAVSQVASSRSFGVVAFATLVVTFGIVVYLLRLT